ncbi:hypothetical protein TELCIR_18288, partial [Teladorsagia circumcincta]
VPIPVYKGAREPLIGEKPLCSESIFFGKDGIGDQPDAFPEVLEEDFRSASEEVAAIALVRLAKEHPTATLHEKEVDFNAHLQYDTKLALFLRAVTSTGRAAMEKNGRQFAYCDEIAVAAAIDLEKVARKTTHLRANVELSGTHSRGQVIIDWVDVLWNNEDAEYVASQGKMIDRKSLPITFVTSYNVRVVDDWLKKA